MAANSLLRPGLNRQCSVGLRLFILKAITAGLIAFLVLVAGSAVAASTGAEVVVIYNSKVATSKLVAEHYASRRGVPATQVIGFDLPTEDTISRREYLDRLQKPFVDRLEA